jgi:serine/threonine protein phosphatase 1
MLYLNIGITMKQSNWESVLRLEKNKDGRDFVCGDIHGCFSYLEERLMKIGFSKNNDRLFCVGDLIDRGPESEKVADYLDKLWFYSVLGNHEEMFINAISFDDTDMSELHEYNYIRNGGECSHEIKYDEELADKVNKFYQAFEKLPLIIQVGDVIIAHAAIPAIQSLKDIEIDPHRYIDTILWKREYFPPVLIHGITRIYVGHTIVTKPTICGIITNIDTGAFLKYREKKGKLTIIEIGKK